MATKKAKKPASKAPTKTAPKAMAAKGNTTVNITEVNETVIIASPASGKASCEPRALFAGFFKKKYEDEDILSIFRSPRIIGAILGEVIGTMLLSIVVLLFGLNNPLYMIFIVLAVTLFVYPLSGANLNPIVTIGAMVTRRLSPVRGVFYILAQLIGAMLGWAIVSGLIGLAAGDATASFSTSAVTVGAITGDSNFGGLIVLELIGALVIAFAFARALKFKKSVFTFASVVAAGVFTALLLGVLVAGVLQIPVQDMTTGATLGAFVFNPALAVAQEAFMAEGTIVWQALVVYLAIPLAAGVAGFLLSDLTAALAGESCDCERKDCKC